MRHFSVTRYNYPVREGNYFQLLVDGNAFFPSMLDSIETASQFILLEQYLFESGYIADLFIDALIVARHRGVAVYVIVDDYGGKKLKAPDRQRLVEAGVNLQIYNPIRLTQIHKSLFRDHRKILIVDHNVVYVGGAGISDAFDTSDIRDPESGWHDVMLEICGPVILDWISIFRATWQECGHATLAITARKELYAVGEQQGHVVTASGLEQQEIVRALIISIENAEHVVWVTSPYFVATWKIRRALRRAAGSGKDVRLLLPGPKHDHPWVGHAVRRLYYKLLRAGVRIFEYQPRFTHAKVQLCDDWVSVGSSNLDRWNHRWNLDANQTVQSEETAAQVRRLFEQDFEQSIEIHLTDWQQRSWAQHLREWWSGRIVKFVERIFKDKQ